MAIEKIKTILEKKFENLDKDLFLGYMPSGSFAKGTMTEASDYDVVVLTTVKKFVPASRELSKVFNRISDYYFKYPEENIDIVLGVPSTSLNKYSVTPEFVEEIGGKVYNEYEWEIIPLKEALKTSPVCRTPLHVQWFKESGLRKKTSDMIKLKKFFSEANINLAGIQGELLVYLFDDFDGVIKRVATGDPINYDFHGRPIEELKNNCRFKNDYMIITDPVDDERNAFGNITKDREFLWKKFFYSAKVYLSTGRAVPKPLPPGHNYAIEYDVSRFLDKESKFNKLLGIGHRCVGLLKGERYDAEVVDVNEKRGLVFVNVRNVSRVYTHAGPFVTEKDNCERFREKNKEKKIFKKDGRLYVEKTRPSVEEILKKEPSIEIYYPGFQLSEKYNFEAFDEETLRHLDRHFEETGIGSVFFKHIFPDAKKLVDFALRYIQDYNGNLMIRELDLPYDIGLDAVISLDELPEGFEIKKELRDGTDTKKIPVNVVYGIKRKLTTHIVIIAGPKESGRHGIYTIYPGKYCPDLTDKKFWERHAFIK